MDNKELRNQVERMGKDELEDVSFYALDTLQKVMKALQSTGHEHLLSDLVFETEESKNSRRKSLREIRDATTIINEDTSSNMIKLDNGKWKIHSPMIERDITADSAFDVIIQYVRTLEEMLIDKTYEKDIRAVMALALNRAEMNIDGNNAGHEVFEAAGVKVSIEVHIQNNIPRWIVDSDESGQTLIHRVDENAIVRVISNMITNKFRENKKKERLN